MIITHTFSIKQWDESTKGQIISFWNDRGINLVENSKQELIGCRGNILGNIASYNMAKIITKLTIKVTGKQIYCEFNINTVFQFITSSNRKYWELELETFESVLLTKDYLEEQWENYKVTSKTSNIIWTVAIIAIIVLLSLFRYI